MPTPIDVTYERAFSGTTRRIYQLLCDMGTSQDAIWPFPTQPFMRSAGPLTPDHTEEWHLGMHAVLESTVNERSIVWKIADVDGVEGTHRFTLQPEGKKVILRHQLTAELSDGPGRTFWKRFEDVHERSINGLFDKLTRVLKR